MSVESDLWDSWQKALGEAEGDRTRLRRELLRIAEQLRSRLAASSSLTATWRPVGVHVATADLPVSGSCSVVEGRRIVLVNASEGPRRQRFTTAHEVAHLLLSGIGSFTGACSDRRTEEERLCDEFASAVLIPRDRLRKHLANHGFPEKPIAVFRLCSAFDVNVHTMLLALSEHGSNRSGIILLARRRGHPHRPDEVDFRAEGMVGPGMLFIPRDQRLASLGLRHLVDWANTAPASSASDGNEDRFEVKLWNRSGDRRSGRAVGPVTWKAYLVGGTRPCLLACITTEGLRATWDVESAAVRDQSEPTG